MVASGGPYGPFNGNNATEIITLLEGATYQFTIFDSSGDGICCLRGDGNVHLYLGNKLDDTAILFVEDGLFRESSTSTFTVSLNSTFTVINTPTMAPTVTSSPSVPFEITIRILQDVPDGSGIWNILDGKTEEFLYEGFWTDTSPNNITETVVVDAGREYFFAMFSIIGQRILRGGFGAVAAGSSYSEDRVLAFIPGNSFKTYATTSFVTSVDALI